MRCCISGYRPLLTFHRIAGSTACLCDPLRMHLPSPPPTALPYCRQHHLFCVAPDACTYAIVYFLGEYLGLAGQQQLGEEQEERPHQERGEDCVEEPGQDGSGTATTAAAGGVKPRWGLHSCQWHRC